MRTLTIFALLLVFTGLPQRLASQTDEVANKFLLDSSRPVDANRYSEIRGTAYRYDEFDTIVIYDLALNPLPLARANYNGFTNQFEYYTATGELRELSRDGFLRADVPQDDGPDHVYARGINPKFPDRYARIIHRGEMITATLIYDVQNDEKVVQDVGKTLKLRRFAHKSLHYAFLDGEFKILKLNAKSLAQDLGGGERKQLLAFIKANKLKPTRDADLVRIYAEAERLLGEG